MTEPDRLPKMTIRQLRQARGWSQRVLAGRLQVGTSTVGCWEKGRVPSPANQQHLAALFGVSVEAIAFGEGKQS